MKYNTLLFDADDTLFDFDKAENTALRSFYSLQKIPVPFDEFKEVYEIENAKLWKALEEGATTPGEIKVNRFVNTMKKLSIYQDNGVELSRVFVDELAKCDYLLEGASEFIASINGSFKMIIITNGLWDVQRRRVGLSDIYSSFSGLIVSEKVGASKPDGIIFEEAIKAAGNPPKETVLMIGDSLTSDIKGGFLYGIDTCWYNPVRKELTGKIKPTYEVCTYKELKNLLFS